MAKANFVKKDYEVELRSLDGGDIFCVNGGVLCLKTIMFAFKGWWCVRVDDGTFKNIKGTSKVTPVYDVRL